MLTLLLVRHGLTKLDIDWEIDVAFYMYTCARTLIRIRALILTWNDILNWGIDVDMDVATGCCYVWNHTCGNCYRYGYC